MQFNKAYKRKRVQTNLLDEDGKPFPSETQQQFKNECDINNILRQYDKTGLITHLNTARAHYGDFTKANEYQEALNLVMDAQDAFMEVPAKVRAQFNNDPGKFMEFVTNPKNHDQLVEMGLANPRPKTEEKPTEKPKPEAEK